MHRFSFLNPQESWKNASLNLRLQWLIVFGLVIYTFKVLSLGAGDFMLYYEAADMLREGKRVYLIELPFGKMDTCGYSYSLFFAMFLIPVTFLPLWLADFCWLLLNIVIVIRIWKLCGYFLPFEDLTKKQIGWLGFWVTIFSVRFVLYNFDKSQITLFLLWACMESVWLAKKEKWEWAGLLLGIATAIKLMPIVVIPYWIYRGYYRAAWLSIGILILCFWLPLPFMGSGYFWEQMGDWWRTINPTNAEFTSGQNRVGEAFYSLNAFFSAFFYADEIQRYGLNRTILPLSLNTVNVLTNLSRLLVIAGTLLIIWVKPFQRPTNNPQMFRELSYLMIASVLIFPHQQKYGFAMLLPAFAYLFWFWGRLTEQQKGLKNTLTILFAFIFITTTLSTDGIIGRPNYMIGEYYKVITFGTFALIAALGLAKVKIINQS